VADVGVRNGHVTGLERQLYYCGGLSDVFRDEIDQFAETRGMLFPEIEDLIPERLVHAANHPVNDIVNIRVVSLGRAVAEHRNRFALKDPFRELMNGHVGPLTWSVYGEETQHRDVHTVEVTVHMRLQFIHALRGGVRADGARHRVILFERDVRAAAVD